MDGDLGLIQIIYLIWFGKVSLRRSWKALCREAYCHHDPTPDKQETVDIWHIVNVSFIDRLLLEPFIHKFQCSTIKQAQNMKELHWSVLHVPAASISQLWCRAVLQIKPSATGFMWECGRVKAEVITPNIFTSIFSNPRHIIYSAVINSNWILLWNWQTAAAVPRWQDGALSSWR